MNNKFKNVYENKINNIIQKSVNILSLVISNIYFPTYTKGLKDTANLLGFKWSDENASGIQSIVWRKRWELTNNVEFRNKLVQYNI